MIVVAKSFGLQQQERDRRRRARANFQIRVEAKLKEAKKKGVRAYTERLAKIHAAETKFLRVRTVYKGEIPCDACKTRLLTPPTGRRIGV